MDRLRRKIQKEIKKRRPGFDEWYENNREKLGCFKEPSAEVSNGNTLAKARNIWLPVVVAVLFIAFCLAVILPFMFNKSDENFDFTFGGSNNVRTVALTDEEFAAIGGKYGFIYNMQPVTKKEALLHEDSDTLAMVIISGDVETADNYYLLTIQIEYDNNYLFGYKHVYENLEYHKVTDEWSITYDSNPVDPDGLYVWFIRMEDAAGQVVYIEVHCFENDINYILNDFIA